MKTTHDLHFEIAPWITPDFDRFRVGTCTGIWSSDEQYYSILGIDNSDKGNGHFEDVLQWFESSCKRDKKDFRILEVWNEDLKQHLITKRGFEAIPETSHVVKKIH